MQIKGKIYVTPGCRTSLNYTQEMPIIVYERELKVLKLFDKIINFIYPPRCIFCQQLLNHDAVLHICENCYGKLPFMEETIIPTSPEGEDGCCDGAISVFHYTGMVKESLIRFKFYSKPSYYRTYARLIADRLSK